jgi:hypothetical protein
LDGVWKVEGGSGKGGEGERREGSPARGPHVVGLNGYLLQPLVLQETFQLLSSALTMGTTMQERAKAEQGLILWVRRMCGRYRLMMYVYMAHTFCQIETLQHHVLGLNVLKVGK